MAMTLAEIAARYQWELDGGGHLEIVGLCGITDNLPNHLSFVKDATQVAAACASRIDAFITRPNMRVEGKAVLLHENPELAMARVAELFLPCQPPANQPVHPSAVIGTGARFAEGVVVGPLVVLGEKVSLGRNTRIHAGCVIGDRVRIGADCTLYPNCVVREECRIGDRVILQPGVVVGGDGYGFVWDGQRHVKIPQLGNVVIEDDVEIGANATIDRGRFTATRIGSGTKIDNLVMVAHNVQIGEHALLVAQSGISGSTRLGNGVTLAGQVGVVGHVDIADQVTVLGQSMVTKSIRRPGVYAGSPARAADQWERAIAAFYRAARAPASDDSEADPSDDDCGDLPITRR